MPTTSYRGTISTDNPEIVERILRLWLSADLRMKLRHGWETRFETEDFELFCYEVTPRTAREFFLLEGDIHGTPESAVSKLEGLAEQCRNADIRFSIEYEEVDADGNPLTEEKTIN
ncbi:hypothetical protein [Nocardia transvalensis]|uniref:hypothetical protein n=1 Tax=Nocardia transvalensis TaxID=37333 RepID=UPI0018935252|nr:hypothetical protein [Nocardia transvalensis]MBF6332782.1 hypothetical protein [Nocardia transvalensis]